MADSNHLSEGRSGAKEGKGEAVGRLREGTYRETDSWAVASNWTPSTPSGVESARIRTVGVRSWGFESRQESNGMMRL